MPTIEINDSTQLDPAILENGAPYIMPLQLFLWYLGRKYKLPQPYTIPYWFEYLCAEKNIVIKVTNCELTVNYNSYSENRINMVQKKILQDLLVGKKFGEDWIDMYYILALDTYTGTCIGFVTIMKRTQVEPKDIVLTNLSSATSDPTEGSRNAFDVVGSILMTSISMICVACHCNFSLQARIDAKAFYDKFIRYGLKEHPGLWYNNENHTITPDTLIPPLSYYRDHGLVNYIEPSIMPYGYNMQLREKREAFLGEQSVPESKINTFADRHKALFYTGNAFVTWVDFVRRK